MCSCDLEQVGIESPNRQDFNVVHVKGVADSGCPREVFSFLTRELPANGLPNIYDISEAEVHRVGIYGVLLKHHTRKGEFPIVLVAGTQAELTEYQLRSHGLTDDFVVVSTLSEVPSVLQ